MWLNARADTSIDGVLLSHALELQVDQCRTNCHGFLGLLCTPEIIAQGKKSLVGIMSLEVGIT